MSKKASTDFESSLKQLETIVTSMEEDSIPLEELLKHYENGTKLIETCEQSLTSARKQLETIRNKAKAPVTKPTKSEDNTDDEIRLF